MPLLETTCRIEPLSRSEEAITHTVNTLKTKNLLKNPREETNFRAKLRNIAKQTDIFNPIKVKEYLLNYKKKDGTPSSNGLKISMQEAYVHFCRSNGIPYDRFTVEYEAPIPLIPNKENIETIINNAPEKYYTPFKIMEETAIEAQELRNISVSRIGQQQAILKKPHTAYASIWQDTTKNTHSLLQDN